MSEKLEVRLRPADAGGDCFYGIFEGETLVLPLVRNKAEGELVCAAVNAIRACAGPLEMDPLEFAKRLEGYPEIGWFLKFATDMIPPEEIEAERKRMDLLLHGEVITVDGKRVDPTKVEIRRAVVPRKYLRGKPPLEEVINERKEEHPLQGEEGSDSTREDPEEGQG